MSDSDATNVSRPKRRRLLWGGLLAIVASITIVGAITHAAPRHFGAFAAMHGEFSPERASRHIKRAVTWVLDDVDATSEQEAKVNDIFQGAFKDLLPLHEQTRTAHERIAQLMSQATVDRAALEQIRASQIALLDTASKRLSQAIEDAADVLTPQQRQQLVEQHHRPHSGGESDL
jgi:Spy/CpxP family protein refolding chaperone